VFYILLVLALIVTSILVCAKCCCLKMESPTSLFHVLSIVMFIVTFLIIITAGVGITEDNTVSKDL